MAGVLLLFDVSSSCACFGVLVWGCAFCCFAFLVGVIWCTVWFLCPVFGVGVDSLWWVLGWFEFLVGSGALVVWARYLRVLL